MPYHLWVVGPGGVNRWATTTKIWAVCCIDVTHVGEVLDTLLVDHWVEGPMHGGESCQSL